MHLCLEIVEGAGAGTLIPLDHPLVIGRDPDADLPLQDKQASRHHARVTPDGDDAILEDLGSTNGTFLDNNEVHGRQRVTSGAEVLIGVTVIQLRTAGDVRTQASAAHAVPPPLAVAVTPPAFVDEAAVPSLERLRDARTKSMAASAPLAILALAALAVILYLGLR